MKCIIFVGILAPAADLTIDINCDNILEANWTAPYSINVPSTDPHITYCVDVSSTFPTLPTLIYSRCGVNETSHQYVLPLLYCAEYHVAVIAVNKVGNSSTTSINVPCKVKGIILF